MIILRLHKIFIQSYIIINNHHKKVNSCTNDDSNRSRTDFSWTAIKVNIAQELNLINVNTSGLINQHPWLHVHSAHSGDEVRKLGLLKDGTEIHMLRLSVRTAELWRLLSKVSKATPAHSFSARCNMNKKPRVPVLGTMQGQCFVFWMLLFFIRDRMTRGMVGSMAESSVVAPGLNNAYTHRRCR